MGELDILGITENYKDFETFLKKKQDVENKNLNDYKEYLRIKEMGAKYVEKEPKIKPLSNWCSYVALFYDDNGVFIGKKPIKYKDKVFYYKDKAFNFLPNDSSYFKIISMFRTTRYYQYNINNPMPLNIKSNIIPVLSTDVYKSVLDSDIITKLNPKKSNILDLIGGWKGLIILLVVGAIIYFFASGGTLK